MNPAELSGTFFPCGGSILKLLDRVPACLGMGHTFSFPEAECCDFQSDMCVYIIYRYIYATPPWTLVLLPFGDGKNICISRCAIIKSSRRQLSCCLAFTVLCRTMSTPESRQHILRQDLRCDHDSTTGGEHKLLELAMWCKILLPTFAIQ